MRVWWTTLAAALGVARAAEIRQTRSCEFYNGTACEDCPRVEACQPPEPDKRNHCFVVWEETGDAAPTLKLKGCFTDTKECYDRADCVEEKTKPKKNHLFCCCEGDMCNANFTWNPASPASEAPPGAGEGGTGAAEAGETSRPGEAALACLAALGLAAVALVAGLALRRRLSGRRDSDGRFDELPTRDPSASASASGTPEPEPRLPVSLLEVKARGRFGAVWRARLHRTEVAVKVFPLQDKQSWLAEQEIYRLPRMTHPNVLQFVGVEKHGDNLQAEYWLVTAYHENGSLCDYLKANTLTWDAARRIAYTTARGLTHLHDDSQGHGRKVAVAHRDFKSKNVLLKSDLSACVADFGLALAFHPGAPCGDAHGQVGTRRYMAPEVLEGAINFTRDAFLRIDMYACGLVLWEIASRCATAGAVGEYALPFEEEVGAHPSLEEMQEAVVHRKARPAIPDRWRKHNLLHVFCDTMEECWDHDAEARLSASCVMERIGALGCVRHDDVAHAPLLIENARPLTPRSDRDSLGDRVDV